MDTHLDSHHMKFKSFSTLDVCYLKNKIHEEQDFLDIKIYFLNSLVSVKYTFSDLKPNRTYLVESFLYKPKTMRRYVSLTRSIHHMLHYSINLIDVDSCKRHTIIFYVTDVYASIYKVLDKISEKTN
jgi:hypothetical protein